MNKNRKYTFPVVKYIIVEKAKAIRDSPRLISTLIALILTSLLFLLGYYFYGQNQLALFLLTIPVVIMVMFAYAFLLTIFIISFGFVRGILYNTLLLIASGLYITFLAIYTVATLLVSLFIGCVVLIAEIIRILYS